jgi:hypothetical protein
LLLYPLLLLEYWLPVLEIRPTVDVVELRRVLLALGLVFDEVLADFTPTIIGFVLQLTIGTLLDALGR